jgi:hypothetical protein
MLEIRDNIPVEVDGDPHLGNPRDIHKLWTRRKNRRYPSNDTLVKVVICHVIYYSLSSPKELLPQNGTSCSQCHEQN